MASTRRVDPGIKPDEATGLYDVKRLAALLDIKPTTVRSLRSRNQLPEPTSVDINGGAVWTQARIDEFFGLRPTHPIECAVNPALPPVVDLFAGCGGMSLGFQLAGFDVVAGYDNWACAVDTYSANLGHEATRRPSKIRRCVEDLRCTQR